MAGDLKSNNLYRQLSKAIFLAAGVVVLLWLFYKMIGVVLLLLFAIVLALAINGPVTNLEKRHVKRGWATTIVFVIILVCFAGTAVFVGPKINTQISLLVSNLPAYATNASNTVSSWFDKYPDFQKEIKIDPTKLASLLPSIPKTLMQVGSLSLSILSQVLIVIVFISMVGYMVTNPRPLFQSYLLSFPSPKRDKATVAFTRISFMIRGWMRSILIGGAINGVAATIFLHIMGVPGAFVWGALAFFTEFIPRIGFFIKAIPPVLIALSVGGSTAAWVAVFYLASDELMADFIMPRVRSNTMKIHPVAILFAVMAMGAAFGFIGILLATPLTGIIKAYYEVFWVNNFEDDKLMSQRIQNMMYPNGVPVTKREIVLKD
ncbi:MAG: AI-2E family transporter [Ferruginibacter sp.]